LPNELINPDRLPNQALFGNLFAKQKGVCQTEEMLARQNKCWPNKTSICQTICVFAKEFAEQLGKSFD
jgi:hypothetical protein